MGLGAGGAGCRIQPGDKVACKKYLLADDGSGERRNFDYEGIVEKVEYNELSEQYSVYVRTHEDAGQIVSDDNLEIIQKNVGKFEGMQKVIEF